MLEIEKRKKSLIRVHFHRYSPWKNTHLRDYYLLRRKPALSVKEGSKNEVECRPGNTQNDRVTHKTLCPIYK